MKLSIREWRPAHLFGAWVTYWALLTGVTLSRPLQLLLKLRGSGTHGTASASIDDGLFTAHLSAGDAVWNMSVSLGTMFGWIAGPPLAIWLVFMATRPSRSALVGAPAPAMDAATAPALHAGESPPDYPPDRVRDVERERVR